ncbi:MAG: hypothetical protein KDM63_20045, partial [Verrucomicrobiae bacterium]|nr:hypothetical protein [Verrucomicrobiae bacterium]
NVLVQGRLLSRAEYEKQMTASAPKTTDLTLEGKSFTGARLSSVRNGVASIMHSGGVVSVEVSQLSDDQVARLNATSSGQLIDKSAVPVASAGSPSMKLPGGNSVESSETLVGKSEAAGESLNPIKGSPIGSMPDVDEVARLLHGKLQVAASRFADEGRHLQVPSAEEIADRINKGIDEFLSFDVSSFVASYVIDNFGDANAVKRHKELMSELASARTAEGAEEIKKQMREHAQNYHTGDIDQLWSFGGTEVGRDQFIRSMSQAMKSSLLHVAFLQETRSRQSVQIAFQREMAGISVLTENQVHDFHSKFDFPTRMDIAKALQTGKWHGVDLSIVGDEKVQEAYKQFLVEAQSRSGGLLGRQLEVYITAVAGDPSLNNTYTEMDERDYRKSVLPNWINEEARKKGFQPPFPEAK